MSFKFELSTGQTNHILNLANKVPFENLLPPYIHEVLKLES